MSFLIRAIEQRDTLQQIERAFLDGAGNVQVFGLPTNISYEYAAAMAKRRPLLILVSDEREGRALAQRLSERIEGRAIFYPAEDLLVYRTLARSNDVQRERIQARFMLAAGEIDILIATVQSLLERSVPKDRFLKSAFTLKLGEMAEPDELIERLTMLGYEQCDLVESPGQFSHRGGLIDVFSLAYEHPVRIEFFDVEVEALRMFDIESQKSIEKMDSCRLLPARDLLLDSETREKGIEGLRSALEAVQILFSGPEFQEARKQFREDTLEDIELLQQDAQGEGLERYTSYFYDSLSGILDYFNQEPLLWTENLNRMLANYTEEYDLYLATYKDAYEKGKVLPGYLDLRLEPVVFSDILDSVFSIHFAPLPVVQGPNKAKRILELDGRNASSYLGKTALFLADLKQWVKKNAILLFVENERRRKMLIEEIQEIGLPYTLVDDSFDQEVQNRLIYIIDEPLNAGAELTEDKLVLVGEREIFSSTREKRKKKKSAKASIRAFTEVNVGDYVVHDQHGVGQYLGITTIETDGREKDYLEIQYAKEDKLFLPVEQLEILEKYVGAEGYKPRMSRLGTKDWENVKKKVRLAVKEIAIDLLALYAKRQMSIGFAYDADTAWQKEFEDRFPFRETNDQLRAIKDTKEDMESMRPMDRIIIGDVGYGKTEVALRAAFKAVNNSKQVALLVPTTVLSNQHYKTFEKRFANWPIRIAVLNRFISSKEKKQILAKVKRGEIDILIGTHRLLSKDVEFSNLGLVIVDEEQKFGVAHKERLKDMRQEVDFLTLSATPIPRTLHMSLSGARDMSIIETPPDERHPVQTYVLEYSDQLVQNAIRKELARGGQVYFIHNKVAQLPAWQQRIERLVPEASLVIAHGQMDKKKLEQAMMTFVEGEADVLLCTTIVESGIDIANVNTLIVNDADHLGLSQIYQLKGRVGRSSRVAHAYFMYRRNKILSEEAEKRLKAIREFTEFGAGFKIAMRDLEIRGAGNILGAEQHGHMLSVGFEMYRRLLEEEVAKLRGQSPEEHEPENEVKVELNVSAHIKKAYIGNPTFKMELYSRILRAHDEAQLTDIKTEIEDRFGPMPIETEHLIDIARIRLKGKRMGLVRITSTNEMIELEFDGNPFDAETLLRPGEAFKRDLLIQPSENLLLRLRKKDRTDEQMIEHIIKLFILLDE
ncbi:transcription-repair coupling factor [Clostridia bacterium]|nr:transcription-repair coupling factor [Clostridia bacterium]